METFSKTTPQECYWEVDGLRLAGLQWGPQDGIPVLALHGWMDHASSFRELAPKLTGCHVIALDLSGQGLSAHRAAHATYNIWDDLPQIAGLLEHLDWKSCVLLGHSRGANIASLFAAAMPEKVRALVALDSLLPEPDENGVVTSLRKFIEQTSQQKARPPRLFKSREEYINRRSARGNSWFTASALADRALETGSEGFRLRADRRLFASSAIKLNLQQLEDVLRSIRCPVLNIWAREGVLLNRPKAADVASLGTALIVEYETHTLAGDHHFHLHPDIAGQIAGAILDFTTRHKLS
ncbi:alpha/beta fold hydrolase [Antarctobacter heliothermus]|nr:alpha/beta hydrolase [Antarctobacter heliothermus]